LHFISLRIPFLIPLIYP